MERQRERGLTMIQLPFFLDDRGPADDAASRMRTAQPRKGSTALLDAVPIQFPVDGIPSLLPTAPEPTRVPNPFGLPGSSVRLLSAGMIRFPQGSLAVGIEAVIELDFAARQVNLEFLGSHVRRRGNASTALDAICRWADRGEWTITASTLVSDLENDTTVNGRKGLGPEALRRWFERRGFEATRQYLTRYDHGYQMRRRPGAEPRCDDERWADVPRRKRVT